MNIKQDKNVGNSIQLEKILGKKMDNLKVRKLINAIKALDDSYEINEPEEEDIEHPNDEWSHHSANKLGITLEFIKNQLCYVSFDKSKSGMEYSYSDSELTFERDVLIGDERYAFLWNDSNVQRECFT